MYYVGMLNLSDNFHGSLFTVSASFEQCNVYACKYVSHSMTLILHVYGLHASTWSCDSLTIVSLDTCSVHATITISASLIGPKSMLIMQLLLKHSNQQMHKKE